MDPSTTEIDEIYDVLIIGAGPAGLAAAARLCEHTPSALFTDEEHRRYHWVRKHAAQMSIKNKKTGSVTAPRIPQLGRKYSTLVLDAEGDQWMSRWNRLFKTFNITHLRSPMFFHVDPGDRDGLLAYTHETERTSELEEVKECVGKEISKHQRKQKVSKRKPSQSHSHLEIDERDRKDYYRPSTSLFASHCECVVNRYGLRQELIRKETVEDIHYTPHEAFPDSSTKIFTIKTDKGIHHARAVILAVGPGNAPTIPGLRPHDRVPGACHALQIQQFLDPSVMAKIKAGKETNVLVVGGGLTSAQISDLAIRRGVTKVWHIMRGELKLKHFDIPLHWVAKFRNVEHAIFWSADTDEERADIIQEARDGGSITPAYMKRLKPHIASGKLAMFTHTKLVNFEPSAFDAKTSNWKGLQFNPVIPGLSSFVEEKSGEERADSAHEDSVSSESEVDEGRDNDTPSPPPVTIDYIYFCTGIQSSINTLPYMQHMLEEYPIDTVAGMPCLTHELMWKDDVPLFVTGRFAQLRLGPGAPNLVGARQGAERVGWGVDDWFRTDKGDETEDKEDAGELKYLVGKGGMFDALRVSGESEDE